MKILNPPLYFELPSEISAAFCATLLESDIQYSVVVEDNSGLVFTVNSGQDMLTTIAIEAIGSKPFWAAVGYAICNFTHRHKHKDVYIEINGIKIKVSGMKWEDIAKIIDGAKTLLVRSEDKPQS